MPKKSTPQELPNMNGPGVEPLEIPEIEKAIAKYQKKKEARCQASPGEIEAKTQLKAVLHSHRDELPRTAEGVPFYRYEDRDYFLEEKLRIQKIEGADGDED